MEHLGERSWERDRGCIGRLNEWAVYGLCVVVEGEGLALEIGMLVDGGTGAPVLLSMEVMSPVVKKSGNDCCNT